MKKGWMCMAALAACLLFLQGSALAASFVKKGESGGLPTTYSFSEGEEVTTSLSFKQANFAGGQKLPVYTGPGTEYFRTGNGYAKASTDEEIYAAGQVGSWALIMYPNSQKNGYIVGYVDLSNLQYKISFSKLNFAAQKANITTDCMMTNVPRGVGEDIVAFKAGESVTYLCSYTAQEAWAYVETVIDRVAVRGFIPAGCVSYTAK